MVHESYDVNSSLGASRQVGNGPFLSATRFQRGAGRQYGLGLGSFLSGAVSNYLLPLAQKHLFPLAKSAISAIAQEGAQAGSNILGSVASGENLKEAFKTEGKKSIKSLARKAGAKLTQAGSGRRKRKVRRSLLNLHRVGQSVLNKAKKRRRRAKGPLGLY